MKRQKFPGKRRNTRWQQAVATLLLLLLCVSVKAEEEEVLEVCYFYNNPCETCHEVENFMADVRESFGTAGAV